MKRCPVCNRTYTDETQNFCLEDGATLVASGSGTSGFGSTQQNQTWQPQNLTGAQPRKKSSPLLWILGILAAVVVLGGVGLFGLLIVIGILANNNNNNNNNNNRTNYNSNINSNRSSNSNVNSIANRPANSNSGLNPNSNSSTTTGRLKYGRIDWGKLDSAFGHGEYIAGEYQVNCKKADSYYVIVIDTVVKDEYVTKNAITKITARSISGASPYLGYGLLIHSDTVALKSDYAFVIRTDKDPAYRIAKHDNKIETDIVKWTSAPQIRTGTQPNELEVRSNGKTLEFYINGQFATSIADNITNLGIVGLYTSGTPVVAFSDLKIYENK
ncbi:MAG TPA: hypothetical protein VF571_03625 [Pyrinomonadaceae bacterium]|jgi:cytoskeletal protein RodZ